MSRLLVVLGVLRLAADRVPHLPVSLADVVVPGPHGDVLGGERDSAVSGSENLLSGEDGASTATAIIATARYGESDLPRIFIPLQIANCKLQSHGEGRGSEGFFLVL